MRGQVLGVDRNGREGRIAGDDGQRYWFEPDDWSDRTGPMVGAQVDFEVSNGRALRIYHVPGTVAPRPAADPARPRPRKDKVAAALLAFFLGIFGVHRFYLGRVGSGIAMLVLTCTLVGIFVTSIWSLIDFIRYLVMDNDEFHHRYG
ncbi:TM2 domain-containing protein [Sphingomonas sp. 2R-10]|uniref:TM2 domain-containing protein n=1 Tax=Sphingomonas sp. 2R-10 TaxID=3045148 RepID=UPI000F77211E|nr:TM2 domain-containing protein [Sphingomonas sp. 2R-10]MDJ0277609.1 TM2 domain-containing protein [Sphingomonas sp. 2R-10]